MLVLERYNHSMVAHKAPACTGIKTHEPNRRNIQQHTYECSSYIHYLSRVMTLRKGLLLLCNSLLLSQCLLLSYRLPYCLLVSFCSLLLR